MRISTRSHSSLSGGNENVPPAQHEPAAPQTPSQGDQTTLDKALKYSGLIGGFGTGIIVPTVITGTILSAKSYENSNKSLAVAEISLAQQLKNSSEIRSHIEDTSTGLADHGNRVLTPKMAVPLHENLMNQIAGKQPQLSIPAAAAAHEGMSQQ